MIFRRNHRTGCVIVFFNTPPGQPVKVGPLGGGVEKGMSKSRDLDLIDQLITFSTPCGWNFALCATLHKKKSRSIIVS